MTAGGTRFCSGDSRHRSRRNTRFAWKRTSLPTRRLRWPWGYGVTLLLSLIPNERHDELLEWRGPFDLEV